MVSIPIAYIGIESKKGKILSEFIQNIPNLPYKLNQGDIVFASYIPYSIALTLQKESKKPHTKILPYCIDATGKRYNGKRVQINIEEWLNKRE